MSHNVNTTMARTTDHQRPNGSIKCGRRAPVATSGETHSINLAIVALRNAKDATNETYMLNQLREAFTISRSVFRGRND